MQNTSEMLGPGMLEKICVLYSSAAEVLSL